MTNVNIVYSLARGYLSCVFPVFVRAQTVLIALALVMYGVALVALGMIPPCPRAYRRRGSLGATTSTSSSPTAPPRAPVTADVFMATYPAE